MSIDFEKDKQELVEKTDLNSLSIHTDELQKLQTQIASSEEQIKLLKAKYDKISSETIPNILAEQGLQSLKLADGSLIEVNKKYSCTIPKSEEKKIAAYKGFGTMG